MPLLSTKNIKEKAGKFPAIRWTRVLRPAQAAILPLLLYTHYTSKMLICQDIKSFLIGFVIPIDAFSQTFSTLYTCIVYYRRWKSQSIIYKHNVLASVTGSASYAYSHIYNFHNIVHNPKLFLSIFIYSINSPLFLTFLSKVVLPFLMSLHSHRITQPKSANLHYADR